MKDSVKKRTLVYVRNGNGNVRKLRMHAERVRHRHRGNPSPLLGFPARVNMGLELVSRGNCNRKAMVIAGQRVD